MTKEELIQLKEHNHCLLREDIQRKSAILRAYPLFIGLGVDARCNLQCIMCLQRRYNTESSNNLVGIDEKDFTRFAEQVFPTAKILQLNTGGEPLMSRTLDLELELAERFGVRIEMTTNGTLLDATHPRFARLIRNASLVSFSIDSPHKETYESIRNGADFSRVVENMRLFQKFRWSLPPGQRPFFSIAMVLMKRNLYELPEMVYFAKKTGADYLHITQLAVHLESMEKESLEGRGKEVRLALSQALRLSRRIGITLRTPPVSKRTSPKGQEAETNINRLATEQAKPLKQCFFLWQRVYIDAGANIFTCCEPSHPVVGSIKTEDFHRIWNNDAYQSMRRTFLGGPPHPLCGVCATAGYFHNLADEC